LVQENRGEYAPLWAAIEPIAPNGWPQEHFFRIGGDEFLIVSRVQSDISALEQRCQLTRDKVSPSVSAQPSAAMGFSIRHRADVPLDSCMAEADRRMYQATAQMKNRRSGRRCSSAGVKRCLSAGRGL